MKTPALLMLFLMVPFGTASAEDLSLRAVQRLCPAPGATVTNVALFKPGKCIEKWEHLGTADGVSLWRGSYRLPPDDGISTSPLLTEALFESTATNRPLRPVWLKQAFSDEYVIQRVAVHRIGRWNIVEAFGCTQGTGGCAQDLLLWTPRRGIEPLADMRATFEASLPQGFTALKAPVIDLASMRIEGDAWRAGDSNSSPALHMTCSVTFDGATFALASCTQ